jgi:hypothetical protein
MLDAEAEKPVPTRVTETEVLTVPDVGLIELTVAAVASVTENPLANVAVPPSLLRTIKFQDPGVTPFRGNRHLGGGNKTRI